MYMERIVAAKAPASPVLRRSVGIVVMLTSIAVMAPFLAICAVWAGAVLGLRALAALPRTLVQMVDYAGTVALGR